MENVKAPEPVLIHPIVGEELSTLKMKFEDGEFEVKVGLFIWGFTSLSTLYRSYHDG